MLEIGVGTVSKRYLRTQLKLLTDRSKPLMGIIQYAPSGPMRGGRFEYIYYLKPYGKNLLEEQGKIDPSEIRIPIGHPQFHKLYHHRKMQVDFHIQLWRWTQNRNITIDLYENDFDTIGGNRSARKLESRTKITFPEGAHAGKFIIPDGAFILNTDHGKKFFLLEFHRGNDVKRIIKQLYYHAVALGEGLPSKKYSINKANRVLVIFEKNTVLNSVRKRMIETPAFTMLTKFFLLKTQENLNPVNENWLMMDGEQESML